MDSSSNPFIVESRSDSSAVTRNDATLINVLTEMGTSNDKSQYTTPGSSVRFSDTQLEILHEQPLINAYCSAIPDSAISKSPAFNFGTGEKGLDVQKTREIVDWLDGFEIMEKMARGQTYANVYGGAAIVYFIDDGQPQDEPLNLKKMKKFLGARVLDRQRVIPRLETATTLDDVNYYDVSTFGVKIDIPGVSENSQIKFHKSRIIPLYGLYLTDTAMLQRYSGWGKSTIEAIWESYRDYRTGILASSGNLGDSSLAIVSMDGFIELLKSNDTATIKKVFASVRNMASNQGMMLIDKTHQDIKYVERQFTGVSQVIDKLREDFIGQTRIPHDKLFGESPSGLGATGDAEEKNWAKEVRQFQERRWRRPLRKQYEMLLSLPDSPLKGKLPEQWNFTFPSIIELGEDEELANRTAQSNIDSTYQSLGILTTDEIRNSRFAGATFSYETTLDQEAYEKAKKEAEAQAAGGGFGGGYGDYGGYGEEEAAAPTPEDQAALVPEEEVPVQEDSLGQQRRMDAMRPSCMDCVTKHLGSALIKGREVENGYPEHIILVVGELSEAEQEVEAISQEAADMIRDLRRDCWAKRRSPMFEEVLAIYDVLGYDWGNEDEESSDIEVPSYRSPYEEDEAVDSIRNWDSDGDFYYTQDGKKMRRTRQGLTKKKIWVEGNEGRYQATRWVKQGESSPKKETSRENRAVKDPSVKERASIPEHTRFFADMEAGRSVNLTKREETAILNWGMNGYSTPKFERVMNKASLEAPISQAEAKSLAAWTSFYYSPINRSLFSASKETFAKGLMTGTNNIELTAEFQRSLAKGATLALSKLPPLTKDGVRGDLLDQAKRFEENGDLSLAAKARARGNKIPDVLVRKESLNTQRIEQLELARDQGDVFTPNALFAASMGEASNMIGLGSAEVTMEIQPKWDGTSNGRYVDDIKNAAFETEVLFPPYAKFKIIDYGYRKEEVKSMEDIAKAQEGLGQIVAATKETLEKRAESLREYRQQTGDIYVLESEAMKEAFNKATTLEGFNRSRIAQGKEGMSFENAVTTMQLKSFPREGLPLFLQKAAIPVGETEEKIVEAFRIAKANLEENEAYIKAKKAEARSLALLRKQLDSQASSIVEAVNSVSGYSASKTGDGGFFIKSSFTEKERLFEEMEDIPARYIEVLDQLFVPNRRTKAEVRVVLKEI